MEGLQKQKQLINWLVIPMIYLALAFSGCCPDPETFGVQIAEVEGEVLSQSQAEKARYDEVTFINNLNLEIILIQESGRGILLSPNCDPDFVLFEGEFQSLSIVTQNDYNNRFLKGSIANELFELIVLDTQCFGEFKTTQRCNHRMIDDPKLFDEIIRDFIGRSEENPTSDYSFAFKLNQPPSKEGTYSFVFEWNTGESLLTYESQSIELTY